MTGTRNQERLFLRVLLWIAIVLVSLVVMPFVGALFAAAVFATVLFPLQQRLSARFGDRPQLAATTIMVAVSLIVILPLVGVTFVAGKRAAEMIDDAMGKVERQGIEGLLAEVPEGLRPIARRVAAAFSAGEPQKGSDSARETNAGKRAGDTEPLGSVDPKAAVTTSAKVAHKVVLWLFDFVIDLGILVLAMYFLLAQGKALVRWVVDTVPLPESETLQFIDELHDVTVAVFSSTVLSAFAQTIAAAVGYLIAGTPMLLVVLMLTMIGAFVPVIGAATVVISVGLLTLAIDSTAWGIFLIAWGALPVGLTDNLLKPLLARGRVRLPGSVLFFAMLGGLALMGPMGVIGGPLVLSFFLVVLRALRSGRRQSVDPMGAGEPA